MNTLLFTAVPDEDGCYRIPMNSITFEDCGSLHPEISARSLRGLADKLNACLHGAGRWSNTGPENSLRLDTVLYAEIKIPFHLASPRPVEDGPTPDIIALADAREAARKNKDYARADMIRAEIEKAGWTVKDEPGGARLVRKLVRIPR